MKHWFRGMGVAALVLASMSTSAELVDTIAAKVDQEVILLSELRAQIYPQLPILQQESATTTEYNEKVDALLQETLRESIETKILYREAVRMGMELHESVIEDDVKSFRAQFKTDEEFMAYLNEKGETLSNYREQQVKRYMAAEVGKTKMRTLRDEVVIAESDVDQYFADHTEEFTKPAQVRIRQIMLRSRRNSDERAQSLATMQQLRDQIIAGADFETLAKAHSEDPAAADGGIIGWQQKGQLAPAIEEAVFSLKKGEVSEIVETPLGVYILRVDDHKEAEAMSKQDARGLIEPALRRTVASEQYAKWVNDLRRRRNVRVYLK